MNFEFMMWIAAFSYDFLKLHYSTSSYSTSEVFDFLSSLDNSSIDVHVVKRDANTFSESLSLLFYVSMLFWTTQRSVQRITCWPVDLIVRDYCMKLKTEITNLKHSKLHDEI